jgi:hypothetical protein
MMTNYEELKILLGTIGLVFVCAGFLISAYQTSQNTKALRANHDWNRRNAAQQALVSGSQDLDIKRKIEDSLGIIKNQKRISLAIIQEQLKQDSSLIVDLHRLLNIYESYARGIKQKIYDNEVIMDGRKSVMIRSFDIFFEYIEYRRSVGSSNAWCNLEAIINDWKYQEKILTHRVATA